MSYVLESPAPFAKVWAASFKNYGQIFKAISLLVVAVDVLPLLLMLALIKLTSNQTVLIASQIVLQLAIFYLFIIIFLRAAITLNQLSSDYRESCRQANRRYLPALFVAIIFSLFIWASNTATNYIAMQQTLNTNVAMLAWTAMHFLIVFIDFLAIVYLLLVFLAIIIDQQSIINSFSLSFKLAKSYWGRMFLGPLLMCIFVIAVVMLSGWLASYTVQLANLDTTSLMVAISVQAVLMAINILAKILVIGFLLLLFKDLKARYHNARHI